MTVIDRPICVYCKRYRSRVKGPYAGETRPGLFCDAFPDGIPETIIDSELDHHEPVAGDHGLQFLAKSDAAAAEAAEIIEEAQAQAQARARPLITNLDLSNDWLYGWGDLPENLDDLRKWLKAHHMSVEEFKDSARYEGNVDRFPWLEDL